MKQETIKTFDKSVYNPTIFSIYKVAKKVIKYVLQAVFIYFAYKGFVS